MIDTSYSLHNRLGQDSEFTPNISAAKELAIALESLFGVKMGRFGVLDPGGTITYTVDDAIEQPAAKRSQ
jgi:hypothetical protein